MAENESWDDDAARRLATILGDSLPGALRNARYLASHGYDYDDRVRKLEHAQRIREAEQKDRR